MASNLGHGVHIDVGEIVQPTKWRLATRQAAFPLRLLMLDQTQRIKHVLQPVCMPGENLTQLRLQAASLSRLMLDDR